MARMLAALARLCERNSPAAMAAADHCAVSRRLLPSLLAALGCGQSVLQVSSCCRVSNAGLPALDQLQSR